jgi:hypothetical protein
MLHKEFLDAAAAFQKGYNVVRVSPAEAERAALWQKIYELEAFLLQAAGSEEQKQDARRELAEYRRALERNALETEGW